MRSRRPAVIALACSALALAVLTAVVLGFHVEGWDRAALHTVQQLHGPALDATMRRLTAVGYWQWMLPLTLLAMAALLALRRWRAAIFVGLVVGGADALANLGKAVFGRPRPVVFPPLEHLSSASYPSGHATVTAALALALIAALWHTRWRMPAIVLGALFALTVSFSRIYLGVHYPSDVLAGWLLAGAWLSLLLVVWPGAIAAPGEPAPVRV